MGHCIRGGVFTKEVTAALMRRPNHTAWFEEYVERHALYISSASLADTSAHSGSSSSTNLGTSALCSCSRWIGLRFA